MESIISAMLGRYEEGKISRRQLVGGLTAVAAASPTAQAAPSTFQGVEINHVALNVADLQRSRDFYQKHLGLPVVQESAGSCFLGMGKNFLTLFRNGRSGMDHYCIAIENYDVAKVAARLETEGLHPRRTEDRVYFPDPDGFTVQLSAADHQP
jgi:catechol-2,3-dioxygenase